MLNYTTAISKRRRGKRVEYIARLLYKDAATGHRKEKSKSGSRGRISSLRPFRIFDCLGLGAPEALSSLQATATAHYLGSPD